MSQPLEEFVQYCQKHIKGDEKGEAQTFLDRFFAALGHQDGHKGAGATFEYRVKDAKKKSTSFADLVWKPRVLIEMKKRGEDLSLHYQQAFSYWMQLVPNRPRYVILCNFDEFWIYDFDTDIYEPLDKIALDDLGKFRSAFAFLLPNPATPVFNTNKEDVTELAAEKISAVFKSMIKRNVPHAAALRYCLQCIIAMFAEDTGLLPDKIFTSILDECIQVKNEVFGDSLIPLSYDLIGGLFREMNNAGVTPTGRYKGVEYFNGGLFKEILPIELRQHEIGLLDSAVRKNWQNVNPAIFGTIFEQNMEKEERHMRGAHYTHETDIMKIVDPVIVQPWTRKIDDADTLDSFYDLIRELRSFKVLDPACGSGNFLFVAFKQMKVLEKRILTRIRTMSQKALDAKSLIAFLHDEPFVSIKQFYGLDIKEDAVELAKVTLMVAKELWVTQEKDEHDREAALPLDNLDQNILNVDALLTEEGKPREWPVADAIIGNPPYQSKNKMQQEFGADYINKLRHAYPEVPGRADFCVYWFHKSHNHLHADGYAGLVATNTIRQNYSREGSLDYIIKNGGTIIDAVSSEPWSGDAVVHVTIASWKKGKTTEVKRLYFPDNDGNLRLHNLPIINSSLSLSIDLVSANILARNKYPKKCFQGQTQGHKGFLISIKEANDIIKENKYCEEVLKPFLTGDELLGQYHSQPKRFVVDFSKMDLIKASSYSNPFKILKAKVLPEIIAKANIEKEGSIKENGRQAWLETWWKMWRRREDMLDEVHTLSRYIAVSRVTKRPIFEFISSKINPNDALMVFAFEDNYSFGIIQSNLHWNWFMEKCSSMKEDSRYTTESVWNTFPWPQSPTQKQIEKVAAASKVLRDARNKTMQEHHYSLRDLYRIVEQPGKNPIKELHSALDKAVMEAYGFKKDEDILTQLLALNLEVHTKEQNKQPVQPPGLPDWVKNKEKFVSDDCVKFEG
jgi:type II restriction/modification system DNA methylase subunit YeeA